VDTRAVPAPNITRKAAEALFRKDRLAMTPAERGLYCSQERCLGPASPYDYFLQLANSRFCLMIRGDMVISNRLVDCMRYGVIPVFLADNILALGLPFVSRVPWQEFSFFVDESRDPVRLAAAFQAILKTSPAVLAQMRAKLVFHLRDFVWHTEASRVFENTLLEGYDHCIANGELNRSDKERDYLRQVLGKTSMHDPETAAWFAAKRQRERERAAAEPQAR
jgi:hypothetical protein